MNSTQLIKDSLLVLYSDRGISIFITGSKIQEVFKKLESLGNRVFIFNKDLSRLDTSQYYPFWKISTTPNFLFNTSDKKPYSKKELAGFKLGRTQLPSYIVQTPFLNLKIL